MQKSRKHTAPPKFAEWMLKKFSSGYTRTVILGDLEEEYLILNNKKGKRSADWWYLKQAINTIPKSLSHKFYWGAAMFRNYIKITFRNIKKSKLYSFINIAGLAVGTACTILILLWVQDELSYDKFNKNYPHIYRACLDARIGNNDLKAAITPAPMANALIRDFPQVSAATKFNGFGSHLFKFKDNVYNEENIYWTDSSIFDVFSFEFIKGNPNNALSQPNTAVISENTALNYFGNEDPIGKIINIDNSDLLVTGIVKDFPSNSHFHFNFLCSFVGQIEEDQYWFRNSYYTYFTLQEGTDPKEFEIRMNEKFVEYTSPEIEEATGISMKENIEQGFRYRFLIQPLEDIHLRSNLDYELEANSDISVVYTFALIAFGILLIAIVNFMNLSTARSSGRAKEVGLRKTLGSSRMQLSKQFLFESIIISLFSLLLAIGIIFLTMKYFNNLAYKDLSFEIFLSPFTLLLLILFGIIIGVLAGSYPAFFLASFNPITVLKGKLIQGIKTSFIRRGLVIFQFSLSIILITGTIITYKQIEFINKKDPGFNKEQVLILHSTESIGEKIPSFMKELESNPNILLASNSNDVIGSSFSSYTYRKTDRPEEAASLIWTIFTDANFADTYQLNFTKGRYFSNDRITDSTGIVLNEAAVKVLGITGEPIGQEITWIGGAYVGQPAKIIGVVEDFHFESFHTEIGPLAMNLWRAADFGEYISLKISQQNLSETIEFIGEKWLKYSEGQPFEYSFLDNDFAHIHANEQRTAKLFTTFSFIALFIACLGLFGLAAYTSEQKTKQIGIRKSLGASEMSILILLNKEFAKLVIISNLLAIPIAYLLMTNWLQDFHYRINLGFDAFIISGILSFTIAAITVTSQALKAAYTNPVNSLRTE